MSLIPCLRSTLIQPVFCHLRCMRKLTALLIILALILPNNAESKSKQLITWYMYDLPPYHILRGDFKGQGPLDYIYSTWQMLLPNYQHKPVPVNIKRMLREFNSTKDYRCITSSFKFPESLEHWVWSKALYVEPPAVIVANNKVVNSHTTGDSADFAELLADKSIVFGHFDGRIYSGKLDNLIKKNIGQPNVLSVSSYAPGESLMRMLQRGRIDYILEYLPEIHWLKLSNQLDKKLNFSALSITNHQTLSPVFVGCVASQWGQQTILQLNEKITDNFRKLIWRKYEKWLYSDFAITHFRQAQKQFFSSDKK